MVRPQYDDMEHNLLRCSDVRVGSNSEVGLADADFRFTHQSRHPAVGSRVSFASTVRLNPIGSYRLPHPHQPNRHRARRTASRIPSRDFLLWRFANSGPQAAEFAATSVTGRHPKTFTTTDMTGLEIGVSLSTDISIWELAICHLSQAEPRSID